VKPPIRTPQKPKKPYAPPRLIRHGKFKDIVQGAGGSKNEPAGGNRSRV